MSDAGLSATALVVLEAPGRAGTDEAAGAALERVLGWVADAAQQQGRRVVRGAFAIDELRASGVTRLVVAGRWTEQGVLDTVRAGQAAGLEVDVLEDATLATTSSRQMRAVREAAALGARIRSWGDMISEGEHAVRVGPFADGTTWLWCNVLREALGDVSAVFGAIEREVSWNRMVHRGGEVPRLVALQGPVEPDGVEPLYRHPADEQPPMHAWTPWVDRVRRAVEDRVGFELNHGLLQLYRHGRDWISEHADKTLDLRRPSVIVNVSFGQQRTMVLRPKQGNGLTEKVPLPDGSLLVMSLATNRTHYHAIRQQNGLDGARISLTFRSIGTFWDRASGAVWGAGARSADRAEAERRAAERRALDPAVRREREREEATAMLRLFRQENGDDAFDAGTAYRPGFEVADLRVLNEG